jgi:hypothetical protein
MRRRSRRDSRRCWIGRRKDCSIASDRKKTDCEKQRTCRSKNPRQFDGPSGRIEAAYDQPQAENGDELSRVSHRSSPSQKLSFQRVFLSILSGAEFMHCGSRSPCLCNRVPGKWRISVSTATEIRECISEAASKISAFPGRILQWFVASFVINCGKNCHEF